MSTARSFALPDLGEGLTEAEILTWLVSVGDVVAVDQPVAEVETAKASVEVPCPYAGTVTRLHGSAGETVAVGAPLITVTEASAEGSIASGASMSSETSENSGTSGAPGTSANVESSKAPRIDKATVPSAREGSGPVGGNGAADKNTESGAVLVGYGTGSGARAWRRRTRGAGGSPESTATGGPPPPLTPAPAPAPTRPTGPTRVVSPLVRRLARENGVDVAALRGSGGGGLVLRRDVEAAAGDAGVRAGTATSTATSTAADAGARPQDPPGTHRTPLRGGHRTMADHLERSRREIPEATVWVDADSTGLVELRRELNEAAPDRPVSVLALVARIALAGLARFPELNAHFDHERREVLRFDHVHLGFAAQTPRGLVVPVVRDAQRLTTRQLSQRLGTTAEAARTGSLGPEAMVGGTFTVNNYGVFGVDGSAAIINHPQAAILGLGRIVRRPWVVGEDVVPRPVTELTLAFDHRVCDGGVAGGFLRFVADCVERPRLLLGDV